MSRVNYDDDWTDEAWALRQGRWERNTRATIKSKRGQAALRDLKAALIALPEKRLVSDTFCEWDDTGSELNVCALGAYALYKGIPTTKLDWLNGESADETAFWASDSLGLTFTLAWNLIERNDERYDSLTPEKRYDAFMAWLDTVIVEVSA